MMPLLRDLAHARTGDKGDTSQVSVIAHDPADFPFLAAQVTEARVRAHLAAVLAPGARVTRYALPALGALNFVLEGALGGGVTRSLALDAHGKCLGAVLLGMALPGQGEGEGEGGGG
ncbi:hypothetical protein ACI6QG_17175 [Roseococcus sp. DSY-14]|uniref:AtuA-related protein n=1 Tax=Roseococcus sp. DSY-14 TaxID=3369650 RepID=UPI00387AB2A7